MKKHSKIMSLLLSGVVAVSMLAACGGTAPKEGEKPAEGAPATETPATETPATEAPAEGTEPAAEGTATEGEMKVVIVTSPSGVDDGSFNQDNYNGIMSFIEKNPGATVKAVQEADIAASITAVSDVLADYDVIVTPGFQFSGISQLATENPDKKFILVDSNPAKIDDKEVFDNVYAMTFAEEESGFFAGVAAALESKTGKVAVVNGIAFPSNVNYQFGFEAGVAYAAKNLGTKATSVALTPYAGTDVNNKNVGGNYVGDFNDESKGKVLGAALIKEGCDIIFVAAGGSGNGVFTAAKEAGNVKVIGCDVDQYDDGVNGDKNIMLTSVLKVMHLNVERSLQSIKDGTFKGENAVLHADTDSTGFVKADGRHQLSPETITKLDEVFTLVKDKKITPPSNFNGHTPANFPGL